MEYFPIRFFMREPFIESPVCLLYNQI